MVSSGNLERRGWVSAARLRVDARGRDGGVRKELAARKLGVPGAGSRAARSGPGRLAHRIHKSKPGAVEATPGSVTERGCRDHLEKSRNSASVHDRET